MSGIISVSGSGGRVLAFVGQELADSSVGRHATMALRELATKLENAVERAPSDAVRLAADSDALDDALCSTRPHAVPRAAPRVLILTEEGKDLARALHVSGRVCVLIRRDAPDRERRTTGNLRRAGQRS